MAKPNLRTALWTLAMLGMLLPSTTAAYFTPEEVLLNKEVFLPPRQGDEAKNRLAVQQETSAERREREWAEEYARQHPAAEEPETEAPAEAPAEEEGNHAVILPEGLSQEDFDLLQAIKLIERRRTERILRFGTADVIDGSEEVAGTHTGAPLAPTGAGAWLAALTMSAAIIWTMIRAKKSERRTWTSL